MEGEEEGRVVEDLAERKGQLEDEKGKAQFVNGQRIWGIGRRQKGGKTNGTIIAKFGHFGKTNE